VVQFLQRILGGREPKSSQSASERQASLRTTPDAAEKSSLERQLREAQKFESIGQLAGRIVHDYNNMTDAILGWAELGSEKAGADSVSGQYFEKIKKQALRAANLTRQLLAFARRQVPETRPMDLNQSIQDDLGLVREILGENIQLEHKLCAEPVVVMADSAHVQQVLMNLCLNARDAMPRGGRLCVQTSPITLDEKTPQRAGCAAAGKYVLLRVSDTGAGISADMLDRIFEPFFTTKEAGKATGLGLAIVQGIVNQHGGHIRVSSEMGLGTEFSVYFPLLDAVPGTQTLKIAEAPIPGGVETVLLADEHEGLRGIAREYLSRLGYRVIEAADGEEAVRLFERNRDKVSLAFFDIVLPKVSGLRAYESIRRIKPGVRALFARDYRAAAIAESSLPENAVIIPKPYSARDLAIKVREVLDRTLQ
jgi:two-component system cell cycle sensor histidine kinase/response regulator CckA